MSRQPGMITISVMVENAYEDGSEVVTFVNDAVIPEPPPKRDEVAYDRWLYEHIFPFTGTGKEEGNAWYDVLVTACSNPALVGETFDFGY